MSKSILSPDSTYLELNKPHEFKRFYQGYIDLLKRKLQRKKVGDSSTIISAAARYITGVIIIGILLVTCGRIPNEDNSIFMW